MTNYHMPDGTFALAGLRVFGHAGGTAPQAVENLNMVRPENDKAVVKLSWTKSTDAIGYNIRYGIAKDKLYQTYQVLGADSVNINSLNAMQKYYFTVDAFNESGVTKGTTISELD
jgi:hypothetical protein